MERLGGAKNTSTNTLELVLDNVTSQQQCDMVSCFVYNGSSLPSADDITCSDHVSLINYGRIIFV